MVGLREASWVVNSEAVSSAVRALRHHALFDGRFSTSGIGLRRVEALSGSRRRDR